MPARTLARTSAEGSLAGRGALITCSTSGIGPDVGDNAGIQHVAPVSEIPPAKWDQILAINLSLAFHTRRLAPPLMRASGFGRIHHRHRHTGGWRPDRRLNSPHRKGQSMANRQTATRPVLDRTDLGQTVLVLQGGGALGAYQVGVYQALHEAGIEPDWVIGTSIGAINAGLIAGNQPGERVCRGWRVLDARAAQSDHAARRRACRAGARWPRTRMTVTGGVPAFFKPNPGPSWARIALGAETAGYYTTEPLEATLGELVDFDAAQRRQHAPHGRRGERPHRRDALFRQPRHAALARPRHGVGRAAAGLPGGPHRRRALLGRRHPLEHAGRGGVRRQSAPDGLVFAVHIWNPHGPEPETIWEVMNRQKDIQYSSRARRHIKRQQQIHRLRHVIAELTQACSRRTTRRQRRGARARRLRLPDPDARRPPARAGARRRGPHQGHRLQRPRHPRRAGRPATPTRSGCWSSRPGPTSSTRSRASSCTRRRLARSSARVEARGGDAIRRRAKREWRAAGIRFTRGAGQEDASLGDLRAAIVSGVPASPSDAAAEAGAEGFVRDPTPAA